MTLVPHMLDDPTAIMAPSLVPALSRAAPDPQPHLRVPHDVPVAQQALQQRLRAGRGAGRQPGQLQQRRQAPGARSGGGRSGQLLVVLLRELV